MSDDLDGLTPDPDWAVRFVIYFGSTVVLAMIIALLFGIEAWIS